MGSLATTCPIYGERAVVDDDDDLELIGRQFRVMPAKDIGSRFDYERREKYVGLYQDPGIPHQ